MADSAKPTLKEQNTRLEAENTALRRQIGAMHQQITDLNSQMINIRINAAAQLEQVQTQGQDSKK